MPSGPIEQQDSAGSRNDFRCDGLKMFLHGLRVGIGHDNRRALASGRTDRSKNIRVVIALILGLAGPCAPSRPLPDDAVLLANPRLVLEPDFDGRLLGQMAYVGGERGGEVFLKVSSIPTSWPGWRGRALMCEKPILCRTFATERVA